MRKLSLLLMFLFIGAACSGQPPTANIVPLEPTPEATKEIELIPSEAPILPNRDVPTSEPDGIPRNPRVADQKTYSFSQLIPFDGIRPVYRPTFATIAETDGLLFEEELILGIALHGEAKAYPISVLRFREMVNDELGGIPTLVTW